MRNSAGDTLGSSHSEALKQELLTHVEWRLCAKARVMFASVVTLMLAKTISFEDAKAVVIKINDFNKDPSPQKEAAIYRHNHEDPILRDTLTSFETELISDLQGLQDKWLLRKDATNHVSEGLMRITTPLTSKMVRELLAELVLRKDCVLTSDELRILFAKYYLV